MKIAVCGFVMGIANLIPGVSGSTMAVIMNIYERLLNAISAFAKLKLSKEDTTFLFYLGVGIVTAIFAGSLLVSLALKAIPVVTYALFLGLVLGSLSTIIKRVNKVKPTYIAAGVLLLLAIELLGHIKAPGAKSNEILAYILGGFFAAGAMILPGLSGSLVLVIMGIYEPVVNSVAHMDITSILIFLAGVLAGIVAFTLAVRFFLNKYRTQTYNFIVGLIIASCYYLFPYNKGTVTPVSMFLSVIALGAGILLARAVKTSARS